MLPKAEARILSASELVVGMRASFERLITKEDVQAFADLSGDHNPLHTNEAYAAGTNYSRRIVHGAFQVGLASQMVGMFLPGQNVVVGSMRSRFPSPLFFPSTVAVVGEITAWMPQAGNGTVRVRVSDTVLSALTAEIHVGFSLHEQRETRPPQTAHVPVASSGLPVVVLTGAGSSLGPHLATRLAGTYHIIGLVRSRARAAQIAGLEGVELFECDLMDEDWEASVDAALGDREAYGLVHAAWPGVPQGGLLSLDDETISRQVDFGTHTTIRLARWLCRHVRGAGRIVVVGSTNATVKPLLTYSAYSLGKAVMENTVRLLAPELASRNITINAILPSFMAQGMNSAKTRQAILSETAKVPLGRLCNPDDVSGGIEYLLSEHGGFVTGQMLPLTGGQ